MSKAAQRRNNQKKKEKQAEAAPLFDESLSLKDRGNKYFAASMFDKALECFTAAIAEINDEKKNDPEGLSILYSNRSATYAAMENFPPALEDAECAISLRPSWGKAYMRKGKALEGLYRYPEAAAAFKQGVETDPADSGVKKSLDDIVSLLSELKMSEYELSKSANPDADRFERMVKWLKDGGARFPKLYLQYYSEDYRGVHCLAKIPPDEIILYVPHNLIMTSQVAMDSEIGQKIIKAKVDLRSKHSYLASFLLQEKKKGAESFWEPYISSLPQKYANMPIFFGPDLLKLLKGSFTIGKIQDRIDSLKAEYDNLCRLVPSYSQFSHEDFVWARLAVITRIFGLNINGTKTDGLVAYADMLNHKKPKDATDTDTRWTFDDNLNGFTITSLRHISRGEQVYDSYGRKCNSRFFVNYGFSLDGNDEDNEAVLKFQLFQNDPLLSMKMRMAASSNGSSLHKHLTAVQEFQIPATYRETSDREKKTKEMFSFVRFHHAVDSEMLVLGNSNLSHQQRSNPNHNNNEEGFKLDDIDPLSIRNEIATLKTISAAAQTALNEFDESLQHDIDLLNKGVEDFNIRNCLIQRRGEKQVLTWFINLAETCVPLLNMPWKDLKRHASKFQSNSSTDHYINNVVAPLVKRFS